MANEILIKQGTEITWQASGGDYAITLTGLDPNSARQGAKADLGAQRPRRYALQISSEFDIDPTPGDPIEVWWAASHSNVAGTGNPGDTSGLDGAYQSTIAAINEHTRHLQFVGALIATSNASSTLQNSLFVFEPPTRYGMPVVVNKCDEDLSGTASDHVIRLLPIVDEVQ